MRSLAVNITSFALILPTVIIWSFAAFSIKSMELKCRDPGCTQGLVTGSQPKLETQSQADHATEPAGLQGPQYAMVQWQQVGMLACMVWHARSQGMHAPLHAEVTEEGAHCLQRVPHASLLTRDVQMPTRLSASACVKPASENSRRSRRAKQKDSKVARATASSRARAIVTEVSVETKLRNVTGWAAVWSAHRRLPTVVRNKCFGGPDGRL